MEGTSDNVTASLNTSSWNVSVEQLLLEHLGPRSKDTVSAVVLTIVYSLIFLSGSLGNICTCIVIVRNHSMQTTTNYYLFSLAVSDLLLLFFGLPPELFSIWKAYPWRFGEVFCYLRSTILELTSYASVLTITAFTVERYIAVCRPLLSHKIAVLSRTVKIIVCIWIVSLVVALPYAAHTRLYYAVTWPPTRQPITDSLVCSIPEKWLEGRMTYMFQISTFLFFLAPVTLIICLYILIGIAVRRSPLSRGSSDDHTHTQVKHTPLPQQPRRVVIRMLVAVTVAFIICWAPFHTQRLMVLYVHHWTPDLLAAQSHIFYISGVLYFVSSTVNPILYNVISRRYRVAFKQTICGPCIRFKSGNSRQRLNSNNLNRHVQHADMAYLQQRHSLLGSRDSLHLSRLCHKNHGIRSDGIAEERASLKFDVKSAKPRVEQLASRFCPDILNCNKFMKAAKDDQTDRMKRDDVSPSSSCEEKATPQTRELNKLTSAPCFKKGHVTLTAKDDRVFSLVEKVNQEETGMLDTIYSENYSAHSDANDNSESRHLKLSERSDQSVDTASRGIQNGNSRSPTSHQHELMRPSARTTCKQCLTNTSTTKGSSSYNGLDAYHCRFDVTEPLTLV